MPEYINPNGGQIRLASTSGHVIFIGADPVTIHPHMESEARARGCLPYSSYLALEEKIKRQMEEREAAGSGDVVTTPAIVAGGEAAGGKTSLPEQTTTPEPAAMSEEQKLKKVVEVIELMLDADADGNYFTAAGLPRAGEVSALAGFEVDKELREKAWETVKEAAK